MLKLRTLKKMKNKISIIIIFALIFLNSCGLPGADARKVPVSGKDRVKKNSEEGKGFRLMNSINNNGGTNFEFASSNELWRASLDTIDFMPLTTANYSGGIIVTDWYSDNENLNESIKVTIRFLTNEIRSDAINLKVFYKNCNPSNECSVSEKSGNLVNELKKQILKKATVYKKQAEKN